MVLKTGKQLTTYDELNAGVKHDTVVVRYSRNEPAAIMIAKDTSASYRSKIFISWGHPPEQREEGGGPGSRRD